MRAITFYQYGGPEVLRLEERPTPEPQAGQVRVAVRAAALNAADWHLMRADPWLARLALGLLKPKHNVLGCDLAGVVEAVGPDVTRFKPGDAVMGELGSSGWGAFAEQVCAPEKVLTHKPANISFDEAAAAPLAGVTALQAFQKAKVAAGEKVLVNGASGGVGTYAVQLAKVMGAHVTAVTSPRNIEQARALGADAVLDYTQTDFTQDTARYDVILATNGYHPIARYKRALAPGGRFVMTGGAMKQMYEAMLLAPWLSLGSGKSLSFLSMSSKLADLETLVEHLRSGAVRSVIERSYTLEQVPEAMTYLEAGHARGKLVIQMNR